MLASPAYAAAAELDIVISAADDELGAYTGTAPFDDAAGPGNDTSALDNVVRTNDYISFAWAISVEGAPPPSTDTTITQTLPEGVVWESLPGFCRTDGNPVSALTNGGRTIICNLGSKGNVAESYNVRAFVKGSVPNGTVINTSATISSSDENTDEVTSNSVSINVTAAPRLNLAKDEAPPTVTSGFRGGVWGHFITFPITLQVEAENGKGTKGFEQIVATQANPLTFKDVLGPGHENLVLDGCGLGGFSSLPGASGGTANSVTHSGSISCALNAGEVDIRIPSATGTVPDLTGSHAPIRNSNGTTVAANTSFLGVYYIRFWIANEDVPVEGLNVSDVFEDFDPVSISGTANYGGAGEPTEDNDAQAAVSRKDPVQGNLEIFKFFAPVNSASSTAWGNNQHIYPGTVFRSYVGTRLQGDLPIDSNDVVLCEIIDTTTYHLTTEGLAAGQQPGFLTSQLIGVTATIEFGTGGAQGHDADAWADMRQENCDDADPSDPDDDTQWAEDWEDLGVPIEQITKVRMKLNSASGEFPPHAGWNNRLTLQLKARNTDSITGDLLEQGAILANFANFSTNFTDGSGTWGTNNYNPQTTGGSWGDRVILARGEVRIAKDSVPSGVTSIVGGDTLQFKLQPTVTGYDLPDGVMRNVVVTDTISQYSDYVVGSGSPEPTSVVPNGNGTTTLTWNLGDLDINDDVEPITYQVKYKLAIPNGAQSVNTAVISSPDDISQQSFRTDTHTVTTSRVSGILVSKQTLTPWTEPEDEHVFQIEYANNAGTAQSWMATIDILPYNGDPLGSNFNGDLRLKEVQVSNGEDIYYTVRDPEEISIYPKHASNDLATGDTKWCLEDDFGTADCPESLEDVTAVMVRKSTPTQVGEGFSYRIVLETENNHSGDIYANKVGVGAGNSPLETSSETVEDHVVASSLGDYVWYDTNRNGLQDQDEDPVEGMTVRLSGTDKHGHTVELETVTNGDGLYLFENLVSGDYEITFVAPDGYGFTDPRQGTDNELDSDADPVTGATGPIKIESPIPLQTDQEDMTWDAGIYALPAPPAPPVDEVKPPPAAPDRDPKPLPGPPAPKKPRIVLSKQADRAVVTPGGRVVYRIAIRNAKPGTVARNVRVCDRLPLKVSLVRAPGARLVKGQVCWRFKRIGFRPASRPIVRRIVVRVDRDARPGARLVNVVRAPGGVKATAPVRVKPRPASGTAPVRGGGVTG